MPLFTVEIPDVVSVSEYARLTGRRPESVRRSIRRGQLQAGKVGNSWLIAKPAVPNPVPSGNGYHSATQRPSDQA